MRFIVRLKDIAIITALAIAGALLVGCAANVKLPQEDQGAWLRIERSATLPGGYMVWVACDPTTGNLLYMMTSGSAGKAVAVVPGGCK